MAFLSKKNNAFSKIATVGGINDSDDPATFSVTTGDGSLFPTSNFLLSVDNEILLVTSRTGDSMTATRAQESTTKTSHSQNADCELRITAGTIAEYEDIFDKTKTTSNAEDVLLAEQSVAPTTPSAGYKKIYAKNDGVVYSVNSSGVEAALSPVKATQAEVATATNDDKYVTPLAVSPYANSSMSRQAIMNGNFDVWQRGTSVALADVTKIFLADRWYDYVDKNSGTLPTLTRSRQLLTSGDIANAFYCDRLATNGAGTSLGVSSYHRHTQCIENGTRNLCGLNKKVTISFWAKSDIANKKIAVGIVQNYGTGGSPTAAEVIAAQTFTLTSTWTKYTATFTTNTLVGKTFGTGVDDYLRVDFTYMWGSTVGTAYGFGAAETYVGAGYIDIAQVQLCAGDVALPFQPKSYEEELRACQRYYYEVSGGVTGYAESANQGTFGAIFPVTMRTIPTPAIINQPMTFRAGGSDVTGTATISRATLNPNGGEIILSSLTSLAGSIVVREQNGFISMSAEL